MQPSFRSYPNPVSFNSSIDSVLLTGFDLNIWVEKQAISADDAVLRGYIGQSQ